MRACISLSLSFDGERVECAYLIRLSLYVYKFSHSYILYYAATLI